MSDIKITYAPIGRDPDYKAWRYEFNVEHSAGRQFSVPILVSDECPEEDRDDDAIKGFRDWTAKVAAEAAKL